MFKKILTLSIIVILLSFVFLNKDALNEDKNAQSTFTASKATIPNKVQEQTILPSEKNTQVQIESIDNEVDSGYIVECNSELQIDGDKYFESQQQFLQSLSSSNHQDKQLAYTLFSEPEKGKSKLDLLMEYNEHFPNNSIALMEALSICSYDLENKLCNQHLVDIAIDSNKNNGAMWLQATLFYISKGDDQKAIDSIRELAKSSFYDEKFGEKMKIFTQALEGSETNNFAINVITGLGVVAANFSSMSKLVAWCKDETNDPDKVNACLQLGSNLASRSKTTLNQMIGLSIQQSIFDAEGNNKAYQIAEEKKQKMMSVIQTEDYLKAYFLMLQDERLLRHWLNNIDTLGESESSILLVEEAITLSQDKKYSPCLN